MKVIAGCVIKRDNKLLMVKEAKKKCYGKWNYPAGHVEEFEMITDAAIRETLEETGCSVKLIGVLPISIVDIGKQTHILMYFLAEIVQENIKFDTSEILDVKWFTMDEIKQMKPEELRGYKVNLKLIEQLENNHIYPVELFNTEKYTD